MAKSLEEFEKMEEEKKSRVKAPIVEEKQPNNDGKEPGLVFSLVNHQFKSIVESCLA